MIVPDVNVLIAATNSGSDRHSAAWAWWQQAATGVEHIGLAWSVLLAFVRITTHPRIMPAPLSVDEALRYVDAWINLPRARVLDPQVEHAHIVGRLLDQAGRGGDLVPDAHLAALAIEHGGTVYSQDADFARFPGVRWVDPTT